MMPGKKIESIPANQAAEEKNDSNTEYILRDGMRFKKTSHGLEYCPNFRPECRKHECGDCMSCGWCSDARCTACRTEP